MLNGYVWRKGRVPQQPFIVVMETNLKHKNRSFNLSEIYLCCYFLLSFYIFTCVSMWQNIGLTIPGNCWSFVVRISHEIQQISCEIMRHSLPTALHETEEFFLNYLIYKVCRWISHEICQIQNMSFWVITKYRSFLRDTKYLEKGNYPAELCQNSVFVIYCRAYRHLAGYPRQWI